MGAVLLFMAAAGATILKGMPRTGKKNINCITELQCCKIGAQTIGGLGK